MTFSVPIVALSEKLPEAGGRIEGGSLLTGGPGLTPLLVRETVQNSWDARDDERGEKPVYYEIHGVDLDGSELAHLRVLLPVKNLDGFRLAGGGSAGPRLKHPADVLAGSRVRALVIADRNTVGLCGPSKSGMSWTPVRHGRDLPRGQQRFSNFVRNTGRATSDIGQGDGGAYGVGKSALWMASSCGTILIHTRTTDESGRPVERFIASVHGEMFNRDGLQYTGRHFVGAQSVGDLVEPLTGSDASLAASKLPIPAYSYDGRPADGTTVIILEPRFDFDLATEMARVRDAVRWHVWPKRVAGARVGSAGPDMEIRVLCNNDKVDLPLPIEDPELAPYANALLHCVTERKSSTANRDFVIRCERPAKKLGGLKFRPGGDADNNAFHITLSETAIAAIAKEQHSDPTLVDTSSVVDFNAPWGQIALIRREPLLLVRYRPIEGPEEAATQVGVFLSANDVDVERALTRAEPPAHDDWDPKNVQSSSRSNHDPTFVRRALAEMKSAIARLHADFRTEVVSTSGSSEMALSAALSQALLGGLGGLGGVSPPTPPSPSVATKRGGPRAELTLVGSRPESGATVYELEVMVVGVGSAPVDVELLAGGSGYDSDGSMPIDGHVEFTWSVPSDVTVLAPGPVGSRLQVTVSDKAHLTLEVTVVGNLRVRPSVDVAKIGEPKVGTS